MARFYGPIGYAESTETVPGVWKDLITEVNYYGDVVRNTRKLEEGEKLNNDISIGNSFSILADAYAYEHIFAMRYIKWSGQLWTVKKVDVQSPRLILLIGGLYNGPTV